MSANEELVELGDLDELARHADRLAAAGEWAELLDLRDRCRAALERGRQLWPAASRAEYRLALDGPGEWAARVLVPGTGRFALGPLPEVAASSHRWGELAPHLDFGFPEATVTAHERVARAEDVGDDARLDARFVELPPRLQSWEPLYPVADYDADEARFPIDPVTGLEPVTVAPGERVEDPSAVAGLLDLARTWTAESNGHAEAVAVVGDATAAVGSLVGAGGRCRMAVISSGEALSRMAWTAASGGANGRRRGMSAGRFGAWWALAALGGLADEWPVDPDDLGELAGELRWFAWDPGGPDTGWTCRLAIEDPGESLAWAVSAIDTAL